ncbi:MAG TPA: cyanophycinase [Terriglobales bacterium]|nr:cyanophycinase [Terriglobales bacterium]
MKLLRRVGLVAIGLALAALASTPTPSHGPRRGYLIISGGMDYHLDIPRLIRMAGGPKARIVVIPTASVRRPQTTAQLARYCTDPATFGHVHCTVLHTTDRAVANSAAFVKPLATATGVWLVGGRQWRLADAYLGTRTLQAIFALLRRGGVVGGGSAGASIQASFMVRGSEHPDDNHIMMAPGHETGFGLFTNVAIDQHVDARHRENDLAVVMAAHPRLLGLGLDQGTSITVHGDQLVVNGPGRVAVWDGKQHHGKGYYYLHAGDRFNTATRVATRVHAAAAGSR